jgi:hypothetical protein
MFALYVAWALSIKAGLTEPPQQRETSERHVGLLDPGDKGQTPKIVPFFFDHDYATA